jgi:protein ImuB
MEALAVAAGFDPAPLVPFAPPPVLEEETAFDEGVESVEPLLFVLRGATSRLSARLEARGEACTRLDVELPYDASIRRRTLVEEGAAVTEAALHERFHVDIPAPLSAAADLFRALRTRLERTQLLAPVTGVRVAISEIARARRTQLDFARDAHADPNSLPALLAELSAEIGPERVGVLSLRDAIRPEARARLVPVKDIDAQGPALTGSLATGTGSLFDGAGCAARLLRAPVSLGRAGSSVIAVTGQLYVVERRRFLARLDDVEWWTDTPCARDYFRVTLASGSVATRQWGQRPGEPAPVPRTPEGGRLSFVASEGNGVAHRGVTAEALVFIDPRTEEAFLHGWFE